MISSNCIAAVTWALVCVPFTSSKPLVMLVVFMLLAIWATRVSASDETSTRIIVCEIVLV